MNSVYIIEANGGSQSFGWFPLTMRVTLEDAERAIKPLLKRWPDAYRIVEYTPIAWQTDPSAKPEKRYRPESNLRSSRA